MRLALVSLLLCISANAQSWDTWIRYGTNPVPHLIGSDASNAVINAVGGGGGGGSGISLQEATNAAQGVLVLSNANWLPLHGTADWAANLSVGAEGTNVSLYGPDGLWGLMWSSGTMRLRGEGSLLTNLSAANVVGELTNNTTGNAAGATNVYGSVNPSQLTLTNSPAASTNNLMATDGNGHWYYLTAIPASALTGTVPLAQLPGSVVTNQSSAAVTLASSITAVGNSVTSPAFKVFGSGGMFFDGGGLGIGVSNEGLYFGSARVTALLPFQFGGNSGLYPELTRTGSGPNLLINAADGVSIANLIVSGLLTVTNGIANYGTGWTGTTNATAPADPATIRAWVNYTNSTGGVFKMPLYQ